MGTEQMSGVKPQESPAPEQERFLRASPPRERWQEFHEMLEMLPGYFAAANRKLDAMRAGGVPDRNAYDALIADMNQAYDRYKEVVELFALQKDTVQDAYVAAMKADASWREAQRSEGEPPVPGKRAADYTGEERRAPLELYDEDVVKLMEDAIRLEGLVEHAEQEGALAERRKELKGLLMDIAQGLRALDGAAESGVPGQSRERKSLMGILKNLNRRISAEAPQGSLSTARSVYRQVKAQYASVQHTLTEEQRRHMRTHIARLAADMRQAEDDAWRKLFVAPVPAHRPPPPPEPPLPAPLPDAERVRAAIQLAVARASDRAATLAAAAFPPAPSPSVRRGIFASLGDAMKLR